MSLLQQAIIRFAMGLALILIGYGDFRKAKLPRGASNGKPGLFERLDATLFALIDEDSLAMIKRATAAILIAAGLGICLSAFFPG